MILSDDEVLKRLNSPMNLLNKLKTLSSSKKNNAMDLFIRPRVTREEIEKSAVPSPKLTTPTNTELPENGQPTLDSLIQNHEAQLQLGLAHNNSVKLLNDSIGMLAERLPGINPEKLPSVITATSKVIESIRKERNEASKNNSRDVHYHFYTPQQRKIEDFEVIDVQ